MAKITRPEINVQGFASSPQSQERTTFGTETESTNLADFLTPEFLRGWGVLPVGGKPPYQWFNGAVYLISQLQAMQFQQGIPEHALSQEFHRNGLTAKNGVLYRSKTDSNTGNDPETDLSNWDINGAVRQNETYSIGLTGDYATINEALESISLRYPVYKKEGVKVKLELEAGFVMQEQVIVRGIDLSWIEITGVDAETVVDRASTTVDFSNGDNIYPVFGVSDGGKGPRISQLFSMNRSGADSLKKGVYATGSGSSIVVSNGNGIKDVYGDGCCAEGSSLITANATDFSGATANGFVSRSASSIDAGSASAGNCVNGFLAEGSGRINARGSNADGCSSNGYITNHGGYISASYSTALNSGGDGYRSQRASTIDASNAEATGAAINGFMVLNGALISAYSATGTTSIAPNSINSDGIIFQ